jgi:Transposase DDE domain
MLETGHFLENTLFVGDAGFVGYEFWQAITERGHHFLVRVGANVNLLTGLCTLQRDGKNIVYCWPQTKIGANEAPLRLRLVKCKIGKNENVWLLTNVLSKRELSNKEMMQLYERRWGIEIQFRALKQTFDRRKLRCRTPKRVLAEIEWSLFGMAVVELMALKEQLKNRDARPDKLSFSQALTALRHSLNNITDCPAFLDDLNSGLRRALIDSYERKKLKSGRYKPNRKSKPSCGEPVIELATKHQRQRYRENELQKAA